MLKGFKVLVGFAVLLLGIGTIYQLKQSGFSWITRKIATIQNLKVENLTSSGLEVSADFINYSYSAQPLLSLQLSKLACRPSMHGLASIGLGCHGIVLEGQAKFSSVWPDRKISLDISDFLLGKHPTATLMGISGGKSNLMFNDIRMSKDGMINSGKFRLTVHKLKKHRSHGMLNNLIYGMVPDFTIDEVIAEAEIENEDKVLVKRALLKSDLGTARLEGVLTRINSNNPNCDLRGTISLTAKGAQEIGPILGMQSGESSADRFSVTISGPLSRANIRFRPL